MFRIFAMSQLCCGIPDAELSELFCFLAPGQDPGVSAQAGGLQVGDLNHNLCFFLFCLQMAVGPGLPCTAGSDEAGQQRNKKMDSLLLKPRMAATSHG